MISIMRAQLYQLKKERLPMVVFILSIILLMIAIINADEFHTLGEVICDMAGYLPQISLMYLFAVVPVICGKDFVDQTGNYEIMSGHTRKELYFGRGILAIVISVVGSLLVCLLVIAIGCLMKDWGDAVSLKDVLLRIFLMAFPFFQIACETVFISFIIRNTYAVLAIGYIYIFGIIELLYTISNGTGVVFLGFFNLIKLSGLESFQTYSPVNPNRTIVVYDASLNVTEVLGIMGISVGVGLVFLLLGYYFFKTDDIR